MKQHFIAEQNREKKCDFIFFGGKFQLARVPRCFDNYNINEWVGYRV